jgi:cytochrome oxidase assembly protein ShyY1
VRSLSFLASRRWALFALAVVVLAWLAWALGEWQFHRLEERKDRNEVIERNLERDPAPVAEVLEVGEPAPRTQQWRRVTATGEYDAADTVVVRYRTRDGAAGVDIVVPLVTEEGPVLLVDRGWLATQNSGARPDDVPSPPAGKVNVTGWVRLDASGRSTEVTDNSVRSISSQKIAEALGVTAYGGFVDLESESPEAEDPLEPAEVPDLGNGPHFFYGLQWWFFGVLAVFGFFYLAYDEWRLKSPEHAPVDGEHDPADE